MTEAWLLSDATAIRRAAGNPNGTMKLDIPTISRLEQLSDPKALLHELLEIASGLHGRHLKGFLPATKARLVAAYTRDFSCLRSLPAFRRLEDDTKQTTARFLPTDPGPKA
jgi:hypothetical protein